jgi:phospholipid/cholesterol/gamma-HCH transport system substrate-binding protein
VTGGGTGGSATGGGLLTGILGQLGLGRAATNASYDAHAPADPFLLRGTGYDPSLGTLLMQGVAIK